MTTGKEPCRRRRKALRTVAAAALVCAAFAPSALRADYQYIVSGGPAANESRSAASSAVALAPRRGECANLLVPVCLSASHMAFGSIRMEPVFFALGQVAGAAAALAVDGGSAVQDVPYERLEEILRREGHVTGRGE